MGISDVAGSRGGPIRPGFRAARGPWPMREADIRREMRSTGDPRLVGQNVRITRITHRPTASGLRISIPEATVNPEATAVTVKTTVTDIPRT
ncbi:MAG: hypothetical protein ACOCSN_06155 [Halanaeroarchaeum sp.]